MSYRETCSQCTEKDLLLSQHLYEIQCLKAEIAKLTEENEKPRQAESMYGFLETMKSITGFYLIVASCIITPVVSMLLLMLGLMSAAYVFLGCSFAAMLILFVWLSAQ